MPSAPRLRAFVLIAYGAPALPLAALSLPVYVHLPSFYADRLGLGLATVGAVLLAARLWDVITDPLIGALSDRIGTGLGRRRPWVIAGTPLVLAATWFLLVPPAGAGAGHLLGWSLALTLGWTMMILPLTAWGAELSGDYHERSRISAYREALLLVGTLLALGLPVALGLGGGAAGAADRAADPGAALHAIAVAVMVLLPLAVGLLLAVVPEPRPIARAPLAWRKGAALIARNRPFRRLILAYLLNGVANGLPATLFLLYVEHGLAAPEWAGLLLLIYFLAGILAMPGWLALSRRFGKHRVWSAAMIWSCLFFALVPLLGPGDVWWFLAVCVLTGVSLGADLVLPGAMQADVVDLDAAESGRQRTGLFFALWGMATKLALALAVGLAFPLLDLAGFNAGAQNPGEALLVLAALYSLVPVIFKTAAIVLMAGYPITAERQAELRDRIMRQGNRDAGETPHHATPPRALAGLSAGPHRM